MDENDAWLDSAEVREWLKGAQARRRDDLRPDSRAEIIARLYSNPRYLSALEDAESDSWDGPGVDVEAMIEAADERRRSVKRAEHAGEDHRCQP